MVILAQGTYVYLNEAASFSYLGAHHVIKSHLEILVQAISHPLCTFSYAHFLNACLPNSVCSSVL